MEAAKGTTYFLEPGYIYFSKRPAMVRSVLGSGVAVCIWDDQQGFGGMIHFLRPQTDEPEKATPQFGNVATAALVRIMEEAGCQRGNLQAQIVGGARSEMAGNSSIGDANVRIAREILIRKGVRVISEDVGGNMGRKVALNTGSGELAVLKTKKIRQTDWLG